MRPATKMRVHSSAHSRAPVPVSDVATDSDCTGGGLPIHRYSPRSARMGREHITMLVGKTAPPAFLQRLTFLAWNHHAMVRKQDPACAVPACAVPT